LDGLLLCRNFIIRHLGQLKPIEKTKVQNLFHCLPALSQPKLLLISEQKADAALRLPA
jgi:hypothetical protein